MALRCHLSSASPSLSAIAEVLHLLCRLRATGGNLRARCPPRRLTRTPRVVVVHRPLGYRYCLTSSSIRSRAPGSTGWPLPLSRGISQADHLARFGGRSEELGDLGSSPQALWSRTFFSYYKFPSQASIFLSAAAGFTPRISAPTFSYSSTPPRCLWSFLDRALGPPSSRPVCGWLL